MSRRAGTAGPALAALLAVVGCMGPIPGGSSAPARSPVPPGETARASGAIAATTPPVEPDETLPSAATWRRLPVDGPTPRAREDHTWTLADDGRTAFLFGGRDGGATFDDLWTFDLVTSAWRRITVNGNRPAGRFGHEAAWLPGRGLVVFAGQSDAGFFNDVWIFDPAASRWDRQPDGGDVPVPRYGTCSGIGPDGRLWISHGFTEDGVRFADTKAYDFVAGRWADEAPAGNGPIQRCLHACWWMTDGTLALYGGQTTGVPALGDLWFLSIGPAGPSTNTWTELSDPGPPARQLAAVARNGRTTFLFGGRGADRKPLGDLWVRLDGTSVPFVALRAAGEAPTARSGATLISDEAGQRLLLFGGLGDDAFADLWELDLEV